ncbi:MAG: carbon-nitrogen hydrolase family protein [Thermaurantiacus sp.]
MRIGLVQMTTGLNPDANARHLAAAIGELAADGATLVFTPEMSGLLDRDSHRLRAAARDEAEDPVLAAVRDAAKRHGVGVVLGSLAVRGGAHGRLSNRSFVIGSDGVVAARYDKLHLFDVELAGGERYRESASFAPGNRAEVAEVAGARLGLSICYDLRFPALYTALAQAGADLLAVPAAFTVPTGRAHWEVLLRARAIETGCFVAAAAQTGRHEDGRETWGHSLVVDPWGDVLLDMGVAPGVATVDLELARVADARTRIPALASARPFAPPAPPRDAAA